MMNRISRLFGDDPGDSGHRNQKAEVTAKQIERWCDAMCEPTQTMNADDSFVSGLVAGVTGIVAHIAAAGAAPKEFSDAVNEAMFARCFKPEHIPLAREKMEQAWPLLVEWERTNKQAESGQ